MSSAIKKLASDLLRLEINTIFTESLGGTKPSTFRRLLCDLAEDYRIKMGRYEAYLTGAEPPSENREVQGYVKYNGGREAYKELLKKSEYLWEAYQDIANMTPPTEETAKAKGRLLLIGRIYDQCNMILDVFSHLRDDAEVMKAELTANGVTEIDLTEYPNLLWDNDYDVNIIHTVKDYELAPDQMAAVQKAYEIGTQQILLQTVVQIDGDITSYVTTRFLDMQAPEQEMMLKMHETAMNTSIRLWQYLFQTIGSLVGGLAGGIFGKKQPSAATGGGGFFKRMFGK